MTVAITPPNSELRIPNSDIASCLARSIMLACAVVACSLVGCGESGPTKQVIEGQALFNGEPIPRGEVIFVPLHSHDSAGLQGRATIVAGRFSTAEDGRGCPSGQYTVEVHGSDGVPYQDREYMVEAGRPLFAPVRGELTVGEEYLRLQLNVVTTGGRTAIKIQPQ